MRCGSWIAGAGKLLSGIGLGAAAMYLLDPDLGDERREDVKDKSARALGTGGAALSAFWERTRENATDAGHKIHDRYDHLREQDVVEQLRHLASGRKTRRRHHDSFVQEHTGLTVVGAAVGALALGAGLMFLLDPQQGQLRRSLLKNQAGRATRGAKGYAQSVTGKLGGGNADQAESGIEVTESDEALAARVRGEIATCCSRPTDVYVSVRGDHIVLSGSLPAEEQTSVLTRCQSIPGVARVVNNLTETAITHNA